MNTEKIRPALCPYADGLNRICDFDGKPCDYWIDHTIIVDYMGKQCPKQKGIGPTIGCGGGD